MGNVPTKAEQNDPSWRNNNPNSNEAKRTRNRRAVSLVSGAFRGNNGSSQSNVGSHRRRTTKEREQDKEERAKQLVVKYNENVDGGFLAPFGVYGFDKLDYDAKIVKTLIKERKLAPFYTPLQDFDESWTKEEIIKIVDGLPLHSSYEENLEEFDDVPVGNINRRNFDDLIDRTLSKKDQRRQRSQIFRARLYKKRILWQEKEDELFLEKKLASRNPANEPDKFLPSDDLKYDLYKHGSECPICFLYLPGPMNYSVCCQQPICTECFVQIRRAEAHFPHEEIDPTTHAPREEEKDPNLLTSEPASCPYCAIPDFSISYIPPTSRRTGFGGIPSGMFTIKLEPEADTPEEMTPRSRSKSLEGASIITSDTIRPDWELKLNKERARLVRRSTNATAIHISNRLVNSAHMTRRESTQDNHSSNSSRHTPEPTADEIENVMMEEAIRLSLEDSPGDKRQKKRSQTMV
ncbi:hypothetical protein NCAS_0D01200 [Naumovozyma castellii]|uniref:Protein SIP5 n=1 Tax=Naumovozyma castellii TaxID=27288 RepID=G0VDR2_NAUCA|nr:hypothetical protein NCAS_0D01200 [Naumovozyma castellii CBS 4309]CCC69701.1 hypothetical protein NCAS_0D01200 [Naumovozyma castellii CBS 4309]